MNTTPKNNGAGTIRRKIAAFQARNAAEKATARAKLAADCARLAASKPTTATAPSPAPGAPLASPQSAPVATVPSTPPPPPASPPPVAASDPSGVLATLRALNGAEYIRYFHAHEKEILAARAGIAVDAGKFAHLHGLDRVAANVRLPKL